MKRKNKKRVFIASIGVSAFLLGLTPKLTQANSATDIISIQDYNAEKSLKELKIPINYNKILYLIENSNSLSEEDAQLLKNEKLLTDIIPYYNGTYMDYLATLKFNDIHINPFSPYEYLGAEGFYNTCVPNVINIKEFSKNYENTLIHEYMHMTQFTQSASDFLYLKECLAEIVKYEYYGLNINDYYNGVQNTRILLEIVGGTPLWKLAYSNDKTELVEIIQNHMSEEDANTLLGYFSERPGKYENETDRKIRALLETLYENMHNTKIKDNPYIKYLLEYNLKNRYYFNSNLITSKQPYYYEEDSLKDLEVFLIKRVVSYEQFASPEKRREDSDLELKNLIDEGSFGTKEIVYQKYALNLDEKSINVLKAAGFTVEKCLTTSYLLTNTYEFLIEDLRIYLPNVYEQGYARLKNSLDGTKLTYNMQKRHNRKI